MKKFLITATLFFSMFVLVSMSLAVSAQPTAVIQVSPEPLRVGDTMYPWGEMSTGTSLNYRFYCEDWAGNQITLASGAYSWYEDDFPKVPTATYNPCCAGGTCEAGESITVSLEVTDSAGDTDVDSAIVTIWSAPLNLRNFMYNRLSPVPRTEVMMEVVPGSEILNDYHGKIVLLDAVSGEDTRVGATLAYPQDLIYPWAEYAVAQSPFNPNLMAVITLDDMAPGGYMDGRAMFSAGYPMYAQAVIVLNGQFGKVEERWLRASGSDIHGGVYYLPSTVMSIRTCAFAKPADQSLPFLTATIPSSEAPLPTPDPNPTPCPNAPIVHHFSHDFRAEVKDNGNINYYW
jgi:hypothetical protein